MMRHAMGIAVFAAISVFALVADGGKAGAARAWAASRRLGAIAGIAGIVAGLADFVAGWVAGIAAKSRMGVVSWRVLLMRLLPE